MGVLPLPLLLELHTLLAYICEVRYSSEEEGDSVITPAANTRKMITHRPLRCADTPLYDSATNIPTYVLSFPPTLVVVASLMLKRWFVQ